MKCVNQLYLLLSGVWHFAISIIGLRLRHGVQPFLSLNPVSQKQTRASTHAWSLIKPNYFTWSSVLLVSLLIIHGYCLYVPCYNTNVYIESVQYQ